MLWTAEIETALRRHARQERAQKGAAEPSVSDATEDGAGLLAQHGRTFHFATRFMPRARRSQVVTLYAFFRTLDDLVDVPEPGRAEATVRDELDAWRAWFETGCRQRAPREPLGSRLAAIVDEHQLPTTIFLDFLRGMQMDVERRQIERFADLREYCYCVAGTVGLAMAHLLGARTPQALRAAEELGVAMQLTNVLRDVGGDLRLGRMYLPADELRAAGLSREHLWRLVERGARPDDAVRALLREQVDRAYAYYQRGMAGIWLLPEDARLPILIAARLYRAILTAIHRNDYDVLRWRAATSLPRKVSEAARALALVSLWRGGERTPDRRLEVQYVD
jgi:15-cis-phytoene synthase